MGVKALVFTDGRVENVLVDDWTEVPSAAFTNLWVNVGGTSETAAYRKDPLGVVHLKGSVSTGTIGTAVFTLPVGYRPKAIVRFAVDSNGAYGMCNVTSAGAVNAATGSNVRFSLDGVRFKAYA